jgi:hypothetical protein
MHHVTFNPLDPLLDLQKLGYHTFITVLILATAALMNASKYAFQ